MADDTRRHPDAILAELGKDAPPTRGRLAVFLGMCPGVGKTYTMLQYARQRLREGVNVAVGVVETHKRAETEALLAGLPLIPRRKIEYKGVTLEEMDIDAILDLHPQLVLVDELAHTNAPGSRHPKRYQDVLELLDAGISVYTTLNVQHIESRVDVVRQITGVTVRETVPDSVFDRADEVQLVDLTPEQLRQRLEEGKVYLGDMAEAASANFFKLENLAALREMALRFAAERADDEVREAMRKRKISGPWKSGERLLVGISHDPQAESLIRWTRRVSGELNCPWIAVYVEPNTPVEGVAKERLTRNLSLARQLGGDVIVTSGQDVTDALLRVAREHNVTQIVVGKPTRSQWQHWLTGRSPAYDLIRRSGYIDIYVVQPEKRPQRERPAWRLSSSAPASEFIAATILTLIVTAVSFFLIEPLIGYRAIALVYLLLVVAVSFRFRRGPVLLVAAASALLWNYLFIPPIFTFYIETFHDGMMFVMLFIVALAMGHFTSRLRLTEETERRRERRTAALYDLAHQAALAPDLNTGLRAAVPLVESLFGGKAALLLRLPDHTLSHEPHPASSFTPSEKEISVATWAFSHRTPAGKFTDTLPDSDALHLPLQARTAVMGVLSVQPTGKLDLAERELLEAFAALIGTILEKDHFIEAFKYAEILETSERLHRALFDSVSHELKTPLAAVQAGLDTLGKHVAGDMGGAVTLRELQTAVRRLRRVIDNLLDMTRIEAGVVTPKREWCDVGELLHEAIALAGEALGAHPVSIEAGENLPMVKLDQALIEQALSNLLLNAAAWSPPGTTITVRAALAGERVMISVVDQGPGLKEADLQRIFEKFYRGANARPGGTGLGLSIVKGFVRAHGGTVHAANRAGGGAEFMLEIPVEIMPADAVGQLA
jgi:two-component system, OmpR family, sensor histidine kinase KdpD